jgi:4-alpha-glucanotransferase
MRVLHFAFAEDKTNLFLPHNYIPNTVAYIGTHDNDTTIGWWDTVSASEKAFAQQYLKKEGSLEIQWGMMQALSGSVANTVIFSMQDVLGLSGEHRMNFPGHPDGNWEWRFTWSQVKQEHTQKLANMSVEYERHPCSLRS